MRLSRCLLLLALVAAASATFGRRWNLRSSRRCGLLCGLTKRIYVRPPRNNGRCLGVLGFLSKGITADLSVSINLFNSCSNIGIAASIDNVVSTYIRLSRAVSLILDKLLYGLGDIFLNLVVGTSRLCHCVAENPWDGGNFIDRLINKIVSPPSICDKEFGISWGLRKYSRGHNWKEMMEYYGLFDIEIKIKSLMKAKFGVTDYKKLTGTRKVIFSAIFELITLTKRDFSAWKQRDYVLITKWMVQIFGAVGSSYKVDTGVAVVDECSQYCGPVYEKKYGVKVTEQWTYVKEELTICDTESFNGAFKVDSDVNADVDNDTTVVNNKDNSLYGRKITKTKTVETTQWEDNDGNDPEDED